jgi:2Fe-2S ferredoxin
MPTITFIEHDGTAHQVTGAVGQSAMQAALFNGVPGIPADCGGACACATCHAYVDDAWLDRVGAAQGSEQDMLETVSELRPVSRLTCQIVLTADMDGLRLQLPETPY